MEWNRNVLQDHKVDGSQRNRQNKGILVGRKGQTILSVHKINRYKLFRKSFGSNLCTEIE